MSIKWTSKFDLAYRFITETNENIFLTGNAGTGKTTFLKYLLENSGKNIIVTAPTGVAAINARGVTLHSLFQLPFGLILPAAQPSAFVDKIFMYHKLLDKLRYNREKQNLLQELELLIIDEVSMVTSFIIDSIDAILRFYRRRPDEPFGGVQLLFIGDLYQLPPVVRNEDKEILSQYYSSPFFFDSYVLKENIPVIIELKEIFRQKDDKFIEILNGIRNNNIDEKNFWLLGSRLDSNFAPAEKEEYITLTTHNSQADEINSGKLKNIVSRAFMFQAKVDGDFPESNYPAEKELVLKAGAQVMFLKNDVEGKQYYNGKIGVISSLSADGIRVKCNNEPEIEVKKYDWQNINYKINDKGEVDEEVVGSFAQFPLRLAYAITIHKSQGLTFDKVIVDAERAFATGQVYVALSRCISLEGLVLRSPVYRKFLGAHRNLKEWLFKNGGKDYDAQYHQARQNYFLQELIKVFCWPVWYFIVKEINNFIHKNLNIPFEEDFPDEQEADKKKYNREKLPQGSVEWIKGLVEKQQEIHSVSEKFRQVINRLHKSDPLIEQNAALQKRVKEAANYFFEEISKWMVIFNKHPMHGETKKLSRKINQYVKEMNTIINEILLKINYCKDGFDPSEYLRVKKSFKQ